VWLITRGVSPIAIALARQVLEHGDYVVAGVVPIEFEKREDQCEDFRIFLEEVKRTERWRERLRVVGLDARVVGQCQAAVAEAVEAFGRIDVLLCAASEGKNVLSIIEFELMLTSMNSCNRCCRGAGAEQPDHKSGG
jgi:NAD(P)-dependent dehydrogenase (short-subunit alcohol dehydrogenase family)